MYKRKKAQQRLSDYKKKVSVEGQLHIDTASIRQVSKYSQRKESGKRRQVHVASNKNKECPVSDQIESSKEGVAVHGVIQLTQDLSDFDLYRKAIQELNAFLVVDTTMTLFALLDFDQQKKELKRLPILVQRNGDKFVCPCDNERFQFSDNVPSCSTKEFDQLHLPCIHVMLVKDIFTRNLSAKLMENNTEAYSGHDHGYCASSMNTFGEIPYIASVLSKWDLVELHFLEDTFYFRFDTKYTFLKVHFGEINCYICKHGKNCYHMTYLNKLLSSFETGAEQNEVLENVYNKVFSYKKKYQLELTCHSVEKIPFCLNPGMQKNIKLEAKDLLPQLEGILQAIPHYNSCHSCGSLNLELQKEEVQCLLFTRYSCEPVQSYSKMCTCGDKVMFDGSQQCIINLGKVMVHYQVLRDFMFQFLLSRSTMFSFYNVWEQHQVDGGILDFKNAFPYNYFRWSWYAFQKRLDIDFTKGFICERCVDKPAALLFDGTSLSFQKQYITAKDSALASKQSEENVPLCGSSYKDRVFIPDKTSRILLKDYCKKDADFDKDKFCQLTIAMQKHQQGLVPLLDHFSKIGCTASCPAEFRELLRILSSNSPVCGSFSFPDIELLETIIDNSGNTNVQTMKDLQYNIPVLFRLFSELHEIPSCLKVLLKSVLLKVKNTFSGFKEHPRSMSQDDDQFAYFPSLPKRYCRGNFTMDGKRTPAECSKKGGTHPSLLPGIFTVFCEHGICYGFELMESVESPDRPFTFLRTRFNNPPPVVIYDNACNLHAYCLNRDPWLFRNTKFRVDGLHWDGHIACSPAYEGLQYPNIKKINTQMVEQNNAKLKRLKPSLSYMKPDNFMQSVKFFLWNCNRQTLK